MPAGAREGLIDMPIGIIRDAAFVGMGVIGLGFLGHMVVSVTTLIAGYDLFKDLFAGVEKISTVCVIAGMPLVFAAQVGALYVR